MTRRSQMRWLLCLPFLLALLQVAARPVPPARFYGTLILDGSTLVADDPELSSFTVSVFAEGTTTPTLASYVMGSNAGYTNRYLVEVPLDAGGAVEAGDTVDIYVNDLLVLSGVTLVSGSTQAQDLSFSLDRPPVLDPIGPQAASEAATLSVTVSATDPDGDAVTLSASGVPTNGRFNPSTGVFTFTPGYDQAGSYTVTFTASAGGLTDSEEVVITVANTDRPPTLSAVSDAVMAEQETLSFSLSASDPDGDTITYSATGLPSGATLGSSSGAFSFTPGYDQAGSYAVTFQATSNSLSATRSWNLTVINVDRPPTLEVEPTLEVAEAALLSVTLEGADPDGDTLVYSATGLPTGASLNSSSGLLTFTPGYDQAGEYPVSFRVDAGDEYATAASTIVVANTDRAPVLTVPGAQSAVPGTLLSFSVSAVDPDGDTVTLSADDVPDNASFNASTGVFTFTPATTQAGETYTVSFTASALELSDTETVQVHVDAPPVLASVGSQTVAEGDTLSVDLSATDAEGDTIVFEAEDLPDGATLDPGSGLLEWTPDYDQAGSYNVVLRAVAGAQSDEELIVITVTNTDRAPVAGPVGNLNRLADEGLIFHARAVDPDGDTVTWAPLGTLPSNVTLNAINGQINVGSAGVLPGTVQTFSVVAHAGALETTVPISVTSVPRQSTRQSTIDEGPADSPRWTVTFAPGNVTLAPISASLVPVTEATERSHGLVFDNRHLTPTSIALSLTIDSTATGGSGVNPQRRMVYVDDNGTVIALTGGITPNTGAYDIHGFSSLGAYDAAILGEALVSLPSSSRLCSTWQCGSAAPHVYLAPRGGQCRFTWSLTSTQMRFVSATLGGGCQAWDSGWFSHGKTLSTGRFAWGIEGVAHYVSGGVVVANSFSLQYLNALIAGPGAECQQATAVGIPGRGEVHMLCPERSDVPMLRVSGSATERLGSSAKLADYTGDGIPDLAVGEPGYDSNRGRVLIYSGTQLLRGAVLTTAAATKEIFGSAAGDELGASLAWVYQSGQYDLVIGAPGTSSGEGSIARVSYSDLSGSSHTVPVTEWFGCEGDGLECGSAMDAADVDGDGDEDLLVGAPDGTTGTAHLFLAGQPESGGGPWLSFVADQVESGFGTAVAVADLDAAGGADVLIGAPDASDPDGTGLGHGALVTFDADAILVALDDLSEADAASIRFGISAGDRLGTSLLTGDPDGDSYTEAMAGAPACGIDCTGYLAWWLGSDLITDDETTSGYIDGYVPGEAFGSSLALTGPQLLIGAIDDASNLTGAIYRIDVAPTTVVAVTTGIGTGGRYGTNLSSGPMVGGM